MTPLFVFRIVVSSSNGTAKPPLAAGQATWRGRPSGRPDHAHCSARSIIDGVARREVLRERALVGRGADREQVAG
jgi:hypothetical protein